MKRDQLFKHELVEVVIPAGSTASRYYLPDLPNLRNVHIWNIETYTNLEVPKSIISGNNVIASDLFRSCFLSLQTYNGKNFLYQRPILTFKTIQTTGDSAILTCEFYNKSFVGQKVNYPKSYIEIANPALISSNENQSILLSVEYSDIAAIEANDRKANFRNQS
jgi:hypothetical protein